MRLHFILLPICVLGFAIESSQSERLAEETRSMLHNVWGLDPEVRRARLERIAEKAAQRDKKIPAATIQTMVPSVKLEKAFDDAPSDIFEINSRLGLDKYFFQGDIHMTEEQLDAIEREMNGNRRSKRQAWTPATRWTNNTVYFYTDANISDEVRTSLLAAHQYIQSHTCINFVESSTAPNRIRVYNEGGCSSALGMVGGEQSLSLGDACKVVGVTAHEFAHALGFVHTQSRSDRDSYVTVNKDNIDDDHKGDYTKLSFAKNTLFTPYEYGSMMHYAANTNAKVKDTVVMTPSDMRYLTTMGNYQISFYDIQMINEFYGCGANCPAQNAPECQNGGYPNPRDCSKCNCPAGYGGDLCDQRPSGCGETLTTTSEWQNRAIDVGDESNYVSIRNDYTICNHWITAPEGKQIEMKINEMTNSGCNYGCQYNGIEIKTETDTRIRNPLVCCDEFVNQTFISSLNPTPIVSFNRYYVSSFNISYRYVDGPAPQPTTTVVKTVPSTTTGKPSCFDIWNDYCPDYVQHIGSCAGLDPALAKDYCAESCGYCGDKLTTMTSKTTQNPSCFDQSADYCERYIKPEGRCADLGEKAAREHCAKTCGYC